MLFLSASEAQADAAQSSDDHARFFASETQRSVRPNFFQKGSARTVFSDTASREAPRTIEFFPKKISAEEAAAEERKAMLVPAALNAKPAESKESEKAVSEPKTPEAKREKLLEEFGDPAKEAPVQAQETAPKPFRGMMAALEAGDDQLAFSYARQHVRYVGRLQERTTRAVGLMGIAMEGEGMAEPGSWQAAREFNRDRHLLSDESGAREQTAESKDLDSQAQQLLARARSAQEEETPAVRLKPSAEPVDPATRRLQIRQELAGKVPVDPGAKVQVFFFFKPLDVQSQRMGQELQGLFAAAKGRLDLMAFSLTPISEREETLFRQRTKATFLINPDGSEIAKGMEVRGAPTTVFVSPRVNRAFAVTGEREGIFVDEVIKMMEGR